MVTPLAFGSTRNSVMPSRELDVARSARADDQSIGDVTIEHVQLATAQLVLAGAASGDAIRRVAHAFVGGECNQQVAAGNGRQQCFFLRRCATSQ